MLRCPPATEPSRADRFDSVQQPPPPYHFHPPHSHTNDTDARMADTILALGDVLPLTCTRAGTCCHGKAVWINPWELASLARARGLPPGQFRERHTEDGGIRLRFAGADRWRGLAACDQYDPARGCVAHAARPLACRLFPLGRERQGEAVRYVHDHLGFPCLAGCPEVVQLPSLTVADYLASQDLAEGEAVSDAYLDLAQDLGEGAFVLVFDSGLAAAEEGILKQWRAMRDLGALERAKAVEPRLLDLLVIPALEPTDGCGAAFVAAHGRLLREHAQASFASLRTRDELTRASCQMLGLALHLARSLGADAGALGDHWLGVARENGLR